MQDAQEMSGEDTTNPLKNMKQVHIYGNEPFAIQVDNGITIFVEANQNATIHLTPGSNSIVSVKPNHAAAPPTPPSSFSSTTTTMSGLVGLGIICLLGVIFRKGVSATFGTSS